MIVYDNIAQKKKDGFESQIYSLLDVFWTIHSALFFNPILLFIK